MIFDLQPTPELYLFISQCFHPPTLQERVLQTMMLAECSDALQQIQLVNSLPVVHEQWMAGQGQVNK